jgi:hypothetical protein
MWQQQMAPFFVPMDGNQTDQGMLRLEQVFYLA